MNPIATLEQTTADHVTAVLILCRTLIHMAYLSLTVSAVINGRIISSLFLALAALIVPLIVARIPKAKTDRRRPVVSKEQPNG